MGKKEEKPKNERLGKVGGSAVLEGVMMRSGERVAVAVRKEDGSIAREASSTVSLRKRYAFFRIPFIRGIVSFVESMALSYKTLMRSADLLGIDDGEDDDAAVRWLRSKLGNNFMNALMSVAAVLGALIGFALFLYLPAFLTKLLDNALGGIGWFKNLFEGLIKIAIFIAYIALVSLMKEMRRTFEYHGAEHKSIACYEKGLELTPENAKTCTRFHPRCGTSFIFVILILSILVNSLINWDIALYLRVIFKLCLLPVIVGIGFEFISYAGKHENLFTKIISAPGLCMQRLTTREPDLDQLEIAITSLKYAMPDEFPEPEAAPAQPDEAAAGTPADASDDAADTPAN